MRSLRNSLVLVLFAIMFVFAAASPVRYLDNVFTNVTVTSNIVYGSNVNNDGTPQTLRLDIYQPTGDTAQARPLVIFLFGGGFAVGTKTDGDMVLLSQTFAKKGYVASSIQYRLDTGLMNTKPLIALGIAEFRGMQDAKAAVRFLRAHKADYKIDDTKIFMGGCSAGAMISLEVAFLDASEIPSFIDTAKVGGIEGNSGTPGVSSAINGVISNWGAVQDSTWLFNDRIPVICFAGTADPQLPYDKNANFCGAACISRVLTRLGVYNVLKPFVGMGHGMATNDLRYDTLLTMASQFTYDVLIRHITPTIRDENLLFTQDQQNAFNRALVLTNKLPSQRGTVYSLNGRSTRKDIAVSSMPHKACGTYIVQPVPK
jgi:poly(3-hydroxybutyrate) depolymerase